MTNLNDDVKLTQTKDTSPEDDEIEVVEVLHVIHDARIAQVLPGRSDVIPQGHSDVIGDTVQSLRSDSATEFGERPLSEVGVQQ